MDDSRAYKNVKFTKTDSPSPSGDLGDVSYAELHFKKLSEPRVRTNGDPLNSTYKELKFRKDEILTDEYEDPPIVARPGELRVTAQTAVHEQEFKAKIGIRPNRLICLFCLVTSALIVIVAGLSIYVSQIRQSLTEKEKNYRSVNETKAQLCAFLTYRRERTCSEDWISHKGRCYYISTLVTSFYTAIEECSKRDSRLFEVNSKDEASFVSRNITSRSRMYWIGKWENRNLSFGLLCKVSFETSDCSQCDLTAIRRSYPCDVDNRFICEKSAPVFPDVPEQIQGLCQQPVV